MTKSELPGMRFDVGYGFAGHFAFAPVAEPGRSKMKRHPPGAADFVPHLRRDFSDASRMVFHQVEGNNLEYLLSLLPFTGGNIPDAAQGGHRTRLDAGLFKHFTNRRLFGSFAGVDVTLG